MATKCDRTGKTKFKTELDANIMLSKIHSKNSRRRCRGREEPTRSYQCEFCLKWHLTGQKKGEGRGAE